MPPTMLDYNDILKLEEMAKQKKNLLMSTAKIRCQSLRMKTIEFCRCRTILKVKSWSMVSYFIRR